MNGSQTPKGGLASGAQRRSGLRPGPAITLATARAGGPLPSIDVADALLDELLEADRVGRSPPAEIFTNLDLSNGVST